MRERDRENARTDRARERERETRHFLNQPKIKMIQIVNYLNFEFIHFLKKVK